jgi:predicted transcriptional regulator
MSSDDPADDGDDIEEFGDSGPFDDDIDRTRERLEESAERAVDEFDQGIVDLLAWLLDTETRARIYVYLQQHAGATSQEVADGTGLYPSTVREALSELHDEGTVTREKRESEGAGNNPYAYRAISPSDLVSSAIGEIQSELNAVFTLDDRLRGRSNTESDPVTISVDEASDQPRNVTGSLEGATEIDIQDVADDDADDAGENGDADDATEDDTADDAAEGDADDAADSDDTPGN